MNTMVLNTSNGKTTIIQNDGKDVGYSYQWVPMIEIVIKETLETRYIDNFGICIHMDQTQIVKTIKRLEKAKKSTIDKFFKGIFDDFIEELKPLIDSAE